MVIHWFANVGVVFQASMNSHMCVKHSFSTTKALAQSYACYTPHPDTHVLAEALHMLVRVGCICVSAWLSVPKRPRCNAWHPCSVIINVTIYSTHYLTCNLHHCHLATRYKSGSNSSFPLAVLTYLVFCYWALGMPIFSDIGLYLDNILLTPKRNTFFSARRIGLRVTLNLMSLWNNTEAYSGQLPKFNCTLKKVFFDYFFINRCFQN